MIYANGFGATNVPVQSGALMQSGTLSPSPVVTIGGRMAMVLSRAELRPGNFSSTWWSLQALANGDQAITATYGGASTQAGTLLTVHN